MKIIQITDPHLYGNAAGRLRGVETDSSLRTVLDEALTRVPDYAAILVTGDLVQDDPAGYLRFRSILSEQRQPVLCVPGNHDEPQLMRRALEGAPFRFCGAHQIGAWNFVMLDSYAAGRDGGRLSSAELERLDHDLGRNKGHAVIGLHHHPVTIGSRWLDSIGLANAEEFWRVVDAHAHVRAVVWGHVHQAYDSHRGRVRLCATPSTGAQFLPKSEHFALDARPPAYRQFELHADGRIDTEVRWLAPLAMRSAAAVAATAR
jgi:3',5'-cyclic-AMP phosphodiesterase